LKQETLEKEESRKASSSQSCRLFAAANTWTQKACFSRIATLISQNIPDIDVVLSHQKAKYRKAIIYLQKSTRQAAAQLETLNQCRCVIEEQDAPSVL
jgi:hypothetical protein